MILAKHHISGRVHLLASAAATLTAMMCPTLSFAQDAMPGSADAKPRLNEIIVTARKKEESLQDVPGAITAVSGADLERSGATDLRALSGKIPNFNVESATTSSSSTQIFLRGIGIDNTGFNTDPNIAIYLDDIFIGRLSGD